MRIVQATGVLVPPHGGGYVIHLTSLANSLKALGAPLILRRGRAEYIIENIVDQTKAKHVFWNSFV
jgi:deoxyribodipyrimidine photolyase